MFNLFRDFKKDIKQSSENYWKNRKINWNQAYWTPSHFHREQLMSVLRKLEFKSALELGCGAGANLYNIQNEMGSFISGIDINKDAIEFAEKKMPNASFDVGVAEAIPWDDKSQDLILTDVCAIYIPPWKIKKARDEMLRVAKKYIVLVEWHGKFGFRYGHFVYNYKKLFKGYKTEIIKAEGWGESGGWAKYGNIVVITL